MVPNIISSPIIFLSYLFNGNIDHNEIDTTVSYGFSARIGDEVDTIGFDYINNMVDTDGMTALITNTQGKLAKQGAYIFHAKTSLSSINLYVEYLKSEGKVFDYFNPYGKNLTFAPEILHLEGALKANNSTYTTAIQKTKNVSLDIPEKRLSVRVQTDIAEGVAINAELWRDSYKYDYAFNEGKSISNLLIQIATKF